MTSKSRTGGGGNTPRRKTPDASRPESTSRPHGDDEAPGVPGFASWRNVYVFVFVGFVVTVIGLAIFSRVFA